jgi:hypothetical protein
MWVYTTQLNVTKEDLPASITGCDHQNKFVASVFGSRIQLDCTSTYISKTVIADYIKSMQGKNKIWKQNRLRVT